MLSHHVALAPGSVLATQILPRTAWSANTGAGKQVYHRQIDPASNVGQPQLQMVYDGCDGAYQVVSHTAATYAKRNH